MLDLSIFGLETKAFGACRWRCMCIESMNDGREGMKCSRTVAHTEYNADGTLVRTGFRSISNILLLLLDIRCLKQICVFRNGPDGLLKDSMYRLVCMEVDSFKKKIGQKRKLTQSVVSY